MRFQERSYQGEQDKELMIALARKAREQHLRVIDLPYRLSSWTLDNPENARLWFDENRQLAGWAALQTPFWTIDTCCDPAFETELHPAILRWADQQARRNAGTEFSRPAWFCMVFADQAGRIRDLEEAGFACQSDVGEYSWSKVLLRRSADAPLPAQALKEGFQVRPLGGKAEVEKYVELHQEVFESKNMTTAWRVRTLESPAHTPELDLVIETTDGRLAAFCICWFDKEAETGQIEPLGSREEFRGAGLGKAILAEGLRRLAALGARETIVETDRYRNAAMGLYESMGFEIVRDVLVYRKDYEEE